MTKLKRFKILDKQKWCTVSRVEGTKHGIEFELDDNVFYNNGDRRYINCFDTSPFDRWNRGHYVEIDLDKTRHESNTYLFYPFENVINEVSSYAMIPIRNAILSASSRSSETLATTREMLDRVDRGEETQFVYQIEEKGVKHNWVYKRT